MPSVRDVYDAAVAHQRAGRIADAESAYRAILAAVPTFADAHNALGIIATSRGDVDAAIAHYQQAIDNHPNFAGAMNNLATALRKKGEFERAITLYRQAIALSPDFAQALYNLSVTLTHTGREAEGIEPARKAIALQPNFPEAFNTLCIALRRVGRSTEAAECGRKAVALRPNYADGLNNLGLALYDLTETDDAISAFTRALELQPVFPQASHNLAMAYTVQTRYDLAIHHYQEALRHQPDNPETLANIGLLSATCGRLDDAIDYYHKSLAIRPDPIVESNLLYTIAQHPAQDLPAIRKTHEAWARRYADPLKPLWPKHLNDRTVHRRLRIGYVSPDFHQHPVGRFMIPLLKHHDPQAVEVFCYSETLHPDEVTERLKTHASVWREVQNLSDEQLSHQIQEDRIDILVDLAMHLRRNRLLCFARKPAPVQVTYLAYPGTTGLDAIDYRLTDAYLDPPGSTNESYVEKSIGMQSYWCFQPLEKTPEVGQLPALSKAFITFGCLNNFSKNSDESMAAWAEILKRVPNSRLLLHVPDGPPRDRVRAVLGQQVNFLAFSSVPAYLRSYRHIDVALDSFPIVGGTTTCDALWGGAPVVTLVGKTAITRSGNSILHNAGGTEWIANSVDQYIDIAVSLTRDLPALSQIRATLRDRLSRSRLMDAVSCTRDLESAFQGMWSAWASSPAAARNSTV
jgi:protein O-GlcNAc transferase